MESEIQRNPDPEDPGTRDSDSLSRASPSRPGSRSISRESFKDGAPEWSLSTALEGSSCRSPSEEKNRFEKAQEVDRECEAMHPHGHMYQLHLSQHTGAWDSIARVNEEILLTMLDIYEKYKSKAMR